MGSFERAHRNQVDLDSFPVAGSCKLLHCPFQPSLLFRAISDAYFHLIAATERIQNSAARVAAFCRGAPWRLVREEVIGPDHADSDEQKDEEFTKACQFGSVWHVNSAPLVLTNKHSLKLEESRNVSEYFHNVLWSALIELSLSGIRNLLQNIFSRIATVRDSENMNCPGLAVIFDTFHKLI